MLLLIFLASAGSAELISLRDYTLDLSHYTLPIRDGGRTHLEPVISEDSIIEGVRWQWLIGGSYNVIYVLELKKLQDSRDVLRSYASMVLGNDTNPEMLPAEEPYPGWMAACKPEGAEKSYTFYVGEVNQRDKVVFISNEDNSTADYIMKGIKVIPKNKL